MTLTESEVVESSAIKWFKEIGYTYIHGSELTPENNERDSYRDVILKDRFLSAVRKINPWLKEPLTHEIYRKIKELDHPDFTVKEKLFYDSLINGVKLTFREGKEEKTQLVKLFDFETPDKNEFLISNQFTVEYEYEKERYRRPDLVLFINGIPVSVFEFKNFNAFETAREAFLDHKAKQRDIPHPETIKIRNDLRFFEMLKKMLVKYTIRDTREISRNLEYEMNQLISRSISAQEPVDILSLMGKEKLDISVLDEQFLSRFKDMEFKNYALDVLTKIMKDGIKVKFKKNPFRYRSLYESLNKLIERYNNKLITVTEIIEQLIIIAKDFKRKYEEGKSLNLTEEELAFYDYLLSERGIFNPEIDLREIAKEIINIVGPYVKISDWHKKGMLKAKIRSSLKMLLPKYIKPEALTEYEILDRISGHIVEHAETLYAMAA